MQIILNIISVLILLVTLLMLFTTIISLFLRVPFVPTKNKSVEKMIKVANIKNGQTIYDLGCGDARLLIAAAKKKKITAIGFEAAPIPFLLAILKKWLNKSKIKLHLSNFFKTNLKDADIIFCYLGPEIMDKLFHKFKKECKKGTIIISNTFRIQALEPKKIIERDPKKNTPRIYLYEI